MSPAVVQHLPMVGLAPRSSEVNRPENQGSVAVSTSVGCLTPDLSAAVSQALACIRMSDKEAAAIMGIDPGRWSRQKAGVDGHYIQLDRLARLPQAFHVEFARIYGAMVGLTVAHDTIADLMVTRVMALLTEVNDLATQLRAMRRAG